MEVVRGQIEGQTAIGKLAFKAGLLKMREVRETRRIAAGSHVRFGE
ncbi:MAG: hypothetical protein GY937_08265 [bacterium]|nr:hypothetical protein [bacterium]